MVALAYLEAYQATGNEWYATVAQETLDFAIEEMRDRSGAFISAIDADTEGEEGGYYLWSFEELERTLNESELVVAKGVWGVSSKGNMPDEVTGEPSGRNVLYRPRPLSDVAEELEMDDSELSERMEHLRSRLLSLRNERTHPMKDDKVLTDWNGLMIAACARASSVLGSDRYLSIAEEAVEALLSHVYDGGHLLHRYRGSTAGIRGKLEDYAYLSWGLFELYEASFNTKHLELSRELVDYAIDHFFDEGNGGFYLTDEHDETPLVRQKEIYDGALPSGNSVMTYLLSLFAALDERSGYGARASDQIRAFSRHIERSPTAFTFFLCGIDLHHGPIAEVRLVGDDVSSFISALRGAYVPHAVVTVKSSRSNEVSIERLVPSMADIKPTDQTPRAYVCIDTTCQE
ncbi:MAG TPA: thioredoxin domain-containing protein, partial [Methanomicrobia archaeon]|nr:thioredoxin domain-containing protein [Methanomicrobia archaeon]